MFIWTIGDAIGLALVFLGIILYGLLFATSWFKRWRLKRLRNALNGSKTPSE